MFLKISTIVLIPALLIQGYAVKKNTLRLPEPDGNRQGMIGAGNPIRLFSIFYWF